MSDNVAITAGSVTSIATDDVGGAHYQRIKLDGGGDGVAAPILGDSTNGLDVDLTRFPYLTATLQNAVSATGNGSTINTTGMGSVVLTISGTFTATVTFEGTQDGSNYSSLTALQLGTGTMSTTANAAGLYQVSCAGLVAVRARVTWTSGTSVTVTATTVPVAWDSKPKNIAQVGGTAIDTNSGNKSAGTQRVVLATDQPALSTAMPVSLASVPSHAVTNAGTFAVQDSERIADDAAFTVGTSKVSPVGIQAVAHGSNPDAADALDAVVPIANRHRVPFVIGGHPNIVTVCLNITTAVTDSAVVTVSSGTKIVVTAFQFTLDNASTVFPKVTLGFGTANTPTTTGVIGKHGGVPAGGGFGRGDGSGIIGIGADNEDLRVTTVGNANGNGLDLVVTYYTIES